MSWQWLVAIVVPGLVAFAAILVLMRSALAVRLADRPNERSLHVMPTPRIGGLGVMAGALPVAACFADAPLMVLLACAAFLALISFADDRQSLPIQVRLPAHAAAATVAILGMGGSAEMHSGLNPIAATLSIVGLVWMTNLFNFMDGSDGLAGGMAAIGFGALALAAAHAGAMSIALVCTAIASASVGFLALNFPPARVFLGDSGSIPLGFLAGALGVWGWFANAWPPWYPILVFLPFIADASVTLLARVARREAFWRAHRGHYYQRLVLGGWTRRRLALASYALMAAAAARALAGLGSGAHVRVGIILVWAAALALLFLAIERRARAA